MTLVYAKMINMCGAGAGTGIGGKGLGVNGEAKGGVKGESKTLQK